MPFLRPTLLETWWLALLIVAAAVAIPLWLHLRRRQAIRVVPWGAMRLLRLAVRHTPRRIRWIERSLLATRMLAIAALLLAVILPQPWAQAALEAFGASPRPQGPLAVGRTHHVIVFDASLSMTFRAETASRFELAIQEVREHLLKGKRRDEAFSIVLLDAQPKLIAGPLEDLHELTKVVESLRPTHSAADLPRGAHLIQSHLERISGPHDRNEVHILTDLQRSTWQPHSEAERQELQRMIVRLSEVAALHVVDLGVRQPRNIAVTHLTARQPIFLTGQEAMFHATIRGYADAPLAPMVACLWVAPVTDTPVTSDSFHLASRQPVAFKSVSNGSHTQETQIEFPCSFRKHGTNLVQVRLEENDGLEADDVRTLVVNVWDRLSVFILDGSAPDDEEAESAYVSRALNNPRFHLDLQIVSPSSLAEHRGFEKADCVILCNVPRLSERLADELEKHVQRGGSAIFFLGDKVNADFYNQRLFRDGNGIFPAEILPNRMRADGEFTLDPRGFGQPLLRAFHNHPDAGLSKVRCTSLVRLRPRHADTVLRFANTAGASYPALLEATRGPGRVFVVAASAHWRESNWPVNPSFVPLVQELLLAGLAGSSQTRAPKVGEPLEWRLHAGRGTGSMRTPDGRDEPFDTFERGGTRSGRFEATGLSGIYQVVPSSDPPTVFGVNAADDPLRSESDPERWTETELRDAFPDRSFHYQTQCCRSRALFGESAWEWPYALLWAVVLILLVEAILTRRAECMRL